MLSARHISSLACSAFLLAACGSENDRDTENLAQISATITQVPAQVACVELRVTGARVVDRFFDVTAGQSSMLNLTGLPTGAVTFNGFAYATGCSSVATNSSPTWISDPTAATLSAGAVTSVTVVLHKNGTASVGVDFQDDDGGALVCSSGMTACGTTCANLNTDPTSCGSCFQPCLPTANGSPVCTNGACGIVCNLGFSSCNRACLNFSTDASNCGTCGNACVTGKSCVAGACK